MRIDENDGARTATNARGKARDRAESVRRPCAEGPEDFTYPAHLVDPRPSILPTATVWETPSGSMGAQRFDSVFEEQSAQIRRAIDDAARPAWWRRLKSLFAPVVTPADMPRGLTGKHADRIIIDDPWAEGGPSPEAREASRRLFENARTYPRPTRGEVEQNVADLKRLSFNLDRDGSAYYATAVDVAAMFLNSLLAECEGLGNDVRAAEEAFESSDALRVLREQERDALQAMIDQEPGDRVEASLTFTAIEEGFEFKPRGSINVVGLVERDLVERYESLRESFAIVEQQRNERASTILELRELIRDACPAVLLLNGIATMTDTECDFLDGSGLREAARCALGGEAFTLPRLYSEEARERAIEVLDEIGTFISLDEASRGVDKVAEALGMRRAGA